MATTNLAEKPAPIPEVPASTGGIRLPNGIPKLEAHYRRRWFVTAPPGATREDALRPEFWATICKHLGRHDIVFLLAADESWELECRVERVTLTGAEITISKNVARTPIKITETWIGDDHYTQHRPNDGWCVIRAKDGFPILKGFTLEVSAINAFHKSQPRKAV